MKNIILLCFLLCATTAQAQTDLLGIKGGFTVTSASIELSKGSAAIGFMAGIAYEQISESGFSFLADLLYCQRVYRNEYDYRLPSGVPTQLTSGVLKPYTYMAMPLRIGGNFGARSYCFANAGLVPAVLIRAETHYLIYDENGDVLERKILDFTRKTNLLDIAGIAEAGVGYKFFNGSRLFGAISYQQSFTNADNAGGSFKHHGLTLALGFKWALPKKAAASTKPVVEE